jgi:putative mRNA 3-end processing factor
LPKSTLITADFKKVDVQNKIVILPPALLGSKLLKKIPNAATAICSGWMHIRGNRRWKGVDAGFAVSDHADWDGLLTAVKATEAEKVYVTHGSQAVFSKYLNEIGIEAYELKTEFGDDEIDKEDKLKTATT